MAATPNCQLIETAVLAEFPHARFGRYNCRHIGSNPMRSWSQHAGSEPARDYFGNALDIWHVDHKPPGKPADSSPAHQAWLRKVRAFITVNYGDLVDQMLGPGDNRAHANHIHMSTFPKMKSNWWYKPPCKGGELIVIYEDGTTGDTFGDAVPPPPPPTLEDDMVWLSSLQRQSEAYFVALAEQTGSPGGNDPGYWGRSHDANGTRVFPSPNDDEWENALDELAAASLEAGVQPGPKGDQGDPGPQGPTGPQGPQGEPGPQPTSATFGYN